MAAEQLNIRLAQEARDELESLAFVRRLTPSGLARDIVLEYLAQHRGEPGMKKAMAARAEHDVADAAGWPVTTIRATQPVRDQS